MLRVVEVSNIFKLMYYLPVTVRDTPVPISVCSFTVTRTCVGFVRHERVHSIEMCLVCVVDTVQDMWYETQEVQDTEWTFHVGDYTDSNLSVVSYLQILVIVVF